MCDSAIIPTILMEIKKYELILPVNFYKTHHSNFLYNFLMILDLKDLKV